MKVFKLKFIILLLSSLLIFNANAKKRSFLYEAYLSKGELDSPLICHGFFLQMTPEQINESIGEIRKFVREEVMDNLSNIDESLIKRILHVHGHIIKFIEEAWVHKKTKKVFRPKPKNIHSTELISLMAYWKSLEKSGVKIHYPKFFASCIDYLAMLLRAYFSYPCTDGQRLNEVEHQWLYWMGRVEKHIDDDPIFGGYYNENLSLFKEVFKGWLETFNKNNPVRNKNYQQYNEPYHENSY